MSWEKIKNTVRRRDGFICQNCGLEEKQETFHVHHVVPRSEGGIDHPDNLVLLCPSCHGKLEGTRRNPTYLENSVRLGDIIGSLEISNVLRIIEEEMRHCADHFHILFEQDDRICNRCLSNVTNVKTTDFQYCKSYSGMLKEFVKIGLADDSVESVMENRSLFYGNVQYICERCGGRGLEFCNAMADERFFGILDNVESVLVDKRIEFSEEVLRGTAERMYILPHNQCREHRVLRRAVNYSVDSVQC